MVKEYLKYEVCFDAISYIMYVVAEPKLVQTVVGLLMLGV